jgi:hypothetical protein
VAGRWAPGGRDRPAGAGSPVPMPLSTAGDAPP